MSFSTTAVGNRVVTSPGNLIGIGGLVLMGTMTNEGDFSTFLEFGRSTVAATGGYQSGGVVTGGATNNTAAAAEFASDSIYIVIYDGATADAPDLAGIFKSTQAFDVTISASASQSFTVDINSFTTAINPANNWNFGPSAVDPAGITGVAGSPPINRTGIVFMLTIPEPNAVLLLLLAGTATFVVRKKKR